MGSTPETRHPADSSTEERRLRHVVEATPNAMVMVDREGAIVLVNAQTEVLFGYERADLLAMRVEDLIPDRFRAKHGDFRNGFFARPDTRSMGAGRDLYGRRKDGTEVPIEIGLNPLDTDEGSFVLASIIDITERKRSEDRLRQVVEAAPNAMVMVNEQGRIVLVNSQTEESFGYSREELLTMRVEELLPERYRGGHGTYRAAFFAQPDRRAMGVGRELFGRRKDGGEIPIEIGLNPIQIEEENHVLASIIDISERLIVQRADEADRISRLRRSILDGVPLSIVATDLEGTILTANPAAEMLTGYEQGELVNSTIQVVRGDHGATADSQGPPTATSDDGRETDWVRRDGSRIPVNEAVAPMYDANGNVNGFLVVAYDISKRMEAQAVVKHMAHHDGLTNLPNRTMLIEHLLDGMREADLAGTTIAVLLLDLDHFKRVNDSLGHHVGDELLIRMAARLSGCVREGDLVSRLGGDEFVVVFGGLDPVDTSGQVAERIDELLQTVAAPIDVNGHELVVTASMGGAQYPVDGADATTLLKNADTAMYHAKVSGRNNFQWFFTAMLDETNDKIALSSALRQALSNGELSVVYQPQVALDSLEVVGVEALARWESPQHGEVVPGRFIPVAEDSGMIIQLGAWVLRQACTDGVALRQTLGHRIVVAVNVSPRQFRSGDLLKTVTDALADTGFDAQDLELEITEGILMDDPRAVIEILHALRRLGVAIVVDDFGTGFSSLAYLTRFPIDKIKIDRSFVRDLTFDDADAAIVDTIIAMAHTLSMKVVAEGVETAAQERYLAQRNCDEAQGFRYSAGISADRLANVIATLSARDAGRGMSVPTP
jgi:diguanylate cyclase (GGDEF)-like protein/PAS domain S-box-containing protein